MASKRKTNGSTETEATPNEAGKGTSSAEAPTVSRRSEFAHMNSILNAAGNQAVSWTIGFKRNVSSR